MLRRSAPLLAVVGLLAALTACGDDSASDKPDDPASQTTGTASATGDLPAAPDSIKVSGAFEKQPTVKWDDTIKVDELSRTEVIKGDGEEITTGDQAFVNVWLASGETKPGKDGTITPAYSDFGQSSGLITLGDQTLPALAKGLTGVKIGSRVVIASPPSEAWGDTGNSSLGIGNADTVVFVVDVESTLPTGPKGSKQTPAAWAPKIVEKDGVPSSLDFSGTPKPSGDLEQTYVIKGDGPKVTKGQHLYVNYLGQVYDADKPFDESYSTGTPFDFVIGQGSVVKGWDQALIGVPVGSRVILQIPPALGYGSKGQPTVGIGADDTMYFVVDVLAAS